MGHMDSSSSILPLKGNTTMHLEKNMKDRKKREKKARRKVCTGRMGNNKKDMTKICMGLMGKNHRTWRGTTTMKKRNKRDQ